MKIKELSQLIREYDNRHDTYFTHVEIYFDGSGEVNFFPRFSKNPIPFTSERELKEILSK